MLIVGTHTVALCCFRDGASISSSSLLALARKSYLPDPPHFNHGLLQCAAMIEHRHTNRLADETSPYLRQHAHSPVDWYPWGPEALQRARTENRPILLSVGYAACHWCHVMERESFENEETAALMNRHFVCIKVDREERPDLDNIYMTAVQMMTQHGGWPLTVFLTPDLKPFFGGTYFPPADRMGMSGFPTVLEAVTDAYANRREQIENVANDLTEHLGRQATAGGSAQVLDADLVDEAVDELRRRFDPAHGGFSPAPKFPHSTTISLLLRAANEGDDDEPLSMATLTLDKMAAGGMYDHIGGGFHRYSTDAEWLVPHFEKMLYDNALLAGTYLEAYQSTGDAEYARVAGQTLDWVLREMQGPDGGYYSTLDADSEGEEGKFYVWSRLEVDGHLGESAAELCAVYDITATGNWEGKNIANLRRPREELLADIAAQTGRAIEQVEESLQRSLAILLEARAQRPRPGLDDKVLTDWNGLMIAAMCAGYRVLGDDRYLASAQRAGNFILRAMMPDGRLLHTYREGRSRLLAYLDDYANMVGALQELYACTFDVKWLGQARALADQMLDLFWNEAEASFSFTGSDHEELIAHLRPGHDGATPSGNAVATTVLQRLATLTGESVYADRAVATLRTFQSQIGRSPSTFSQMLLALDYYLREPREIALVGKLDDASTRQALSDLWRRYTPHEVVAVLDPSAADAARIEAEVPLLRSKTAIDGTLTFYVCRNYACQAPTTDLEEILGAS